MHTFVVVSGLPGSGKTTLAAELAKHLEIAHLDKDLILEAYFRAEAEVTAERRNELSRRADSELKKAALSLQSAVLSSWWRHPRAVRDSGTPVQWLQDGGIKVVEVYCRCSAEVAAHRFETRQRHTGHGDDRRNRDHLREQLVEAESLGPLFPEAALMCDTAAPVPPATVSSLASQVRALGSAPSEA